MYYISTLESRIIGAMNKSYSCVVLIFVGITFHLTSWSNDTIQCSYFFVMRRRGS